MADWLSSLWTGTAAQGPGAGLQGPATAATSGLFGSGGQFNPFMAAGTIGMGLGAAQAFGGSSGFAPTYKINLSKEGKALEKTLQQTVKKQYEGGLLPANLASIYIGRLKREEGGRQRAAQGMMGRFAGRRVGTGQSVRAALGESGARMEGLMAPTEWQTGFREDEFRNALGNLQNIRNLELQTPYLKAQAGFTGSLLQQRRRASQGQALGDIAQYLAMMKYPTPGLYG